MLTDGRPCGRNAVVRLVTFDCAREVIINPLYHCRHSADYQYDNER